MVLVPRARPESQIIMNASRLLRTRLLRLRQNEARALARFSQSTHDVAAVAPSILSDERITAPPDHNRLLQIIPAGLSGLGLGAIFSVPGVLGPSMCTAQGVVAQSATDFSMGGLVPIMSLMPLLASSTAAILAKRSDTFGTRRLALVSSVMYPLGCYALPAVAVQANSLSGFAASYVLVGGLGFYAGYPQVPPFLMKWFPTRSGCVLRTRIQILPDHGRPRNACRLPCCRRVR